jgi:HK97 family phage prohead protease
MTDRIVRFSTDITAADSERRTIVGTVVPYGSVGNTSLGPVRFQPGSVRASETVKLVLEHDLKRPIGRATGFVDGPERLVGSFRLSHTTAASDALVEASDGLRDGLSVGARIVEHTIDESGTMVVTAADLVEVSLVHTPAFTEAVVTQVAASDPETDDTPTESEEDIVENETTEVAAAEVAASHEPTVEAARPSIPYITAQPRDLKGLTAGGMLRAQLRTQLFDDQDAGDLVRAAFAGQTTTTDQGLIPIPLLREIIGVVDDSRNFINSIDRQPLPQSGMSFRIPSITTQVTVNEQLTQNTDVDSTEGDIDDITVNIKTFAGGNRVSRQLIDRSDPQYFDELLRQLAAAYARKVNQFAFETAAATRGDSTQAATIYESVVNGIVDSYNVMKFTPNRLIVSPSGPDSITWAKILSDVDQDGRPIISAANPSNAGGLVTQGTTNGTVAGLDLVVDPNIGEQNGHVYPSGFATFYENPGSPFQVSIDNPEKLSVEVSVFGYVALAVKYPTAFTRVRTT